jgi:hypothetical protein
MVKKIMQPLSNDKVALALGPGTRILKYSQLKDYETINDLLPNMNDFIILLLEDDMNTGHWVTMMRTPTGFYYFNSYGQKYDDDLSIVPRCIRRILGEDRREITRLLDGKEMKWNKHKFQSARTQVCGRYCILAVTMICKMLYSPEIFEDFLLRKTKEFKEPTDQLVAKWCDV